MTSPESQTPQAGWYADKRGGLRWWDGAGWTDHRQSGDGVVWTDSRAGAVSGATSPSPLGTILGLVGSVVLFFSTFSRWMTTSNGEAYNAYDTGLPWMVTGANYDPTFEAGLFAHGMVLAVLAIAGGFLVIRASQGRSDQSGGYATMVGVVVLLLVLANAFAFRGAFSTLNEARSSSVGIGIGLWLAFLSAIAIIASGVMVSPRR